MYEENEEGPFTLGSVINATFNLQYYILGKKCHRKNPYQFKVLCTDFCTHLSTTLKLLCTNCTIFQTMYSQLTQFRTIRDTTVVSHIEASCCSVSYSIPANKNHQCVLECVICETCIFSVTQDGIVCVLFHNTATC